MATSAEGIAVVIPTHLRASVLDRSLASVAAQSVPPDEIAVVDDTGDAATAEVCRQWQARGLPLQYLVQTAGPGPSRSRNYGAAATTSSLLAFLDDDDSWYPTHLATALAYLGQEPREPAGADGVLTGRKQKPGSQTGAGARRSPEPVIPALRGWPGDRARLGRDLRNISGSNLVLRRSWFAWVGGFDPDLYAANDKDLLYRLLLAGARLVPAPSLTVQALSHGGAHITDPYTPRRLAAHWQFYRKHRTAMTLGLRKKWRAFLALEAFLAAERPSLGQRARLILAFLADRRVRQFLRKRRRA